MLRATLKGLLHRKLRLLLAVIAVVLGVGFVSGANVLTDSLSAGFDKLFQTVDLDEIRAVDGVRVVDGDVSAEGVIPFKSDGKAVNTGGPPSFGVGLEAERL